MFCQKCGAKVDEQSSFCSNCGAKQAVFNYQPNQSSSQFNTSVKTKNSSNKTIIGVVFIVLGVFLSYIGNYGVKSSMWSVWVTNENGDIYLGMVMVGVILIVIGVVMVIASLIKKK